MANAVIVVDMQNGFMRPDGTLYCGDHAREIIPRIAARVEREKAAGASLFFTQDSHTADDREFEMFPPHCIEGSEEEHIMSTSWHRWPKTRRSSKSGATVPFSRPSWPRCWTS